METPQCHGGFADVWKGQYGYRKVAAKALRISLTSDLDRIRRVDDSRIVIFVNELTCQAQRFCKEVMTWNTLRHPNVLPLVGVVMTERRFVMVSEWMENGDINVYVKANAEADRLALVRFPPRSIFIILTW